MMKVQIAINVGSPSADEGFAKNRDSYIKMHQICILSDPIITVTVVDVFVMSRAGEWCVLRLF